MTEEDSLEFDASLRGNLDAARTLLEPTGQRREDLFAQISLALEATVPADVPSPADAPIAAAAQGAPALPIKLIVVSGITSALIGTAAAVYWPSSQPAAPPVQTSSHLVQRSAPQKEQSAPVDAKEAPDDAPAQPSPERSSARRTAETTVEESAPPEPLSLSEELSHVRRAQAALRDGNPALALELMQSLDEARTAGALLAERGVTRVLALCALGRQADAEAAARAVLERADGSVYQQRLATSCAKDALAPRPSDETPPRRH